MNDRHFLPGTLDVMVLQALSVRPMHGYEIAKSISRASRGALTVLDGALYASLHRLEERDWIESRRSRSAQGKSVRIYELTTQGRRQCSLELNRWLKYQTTVARVLKSVGRI